MEATFKKQTSPNTGPEGAKDKQQQAAGSEKETDSKKEWWEQLAGDYPG